MRRRVRRERAALRSRSAPRSGRDLVLHDRLRERSERVPERVRVHRGRGLGRSSVLRALREQRAGRRADRGGVPLRRRLRAGTGWRRDLVRGGRLPGDELSRERPELVPREPRLRSGPRSAELLRGVHRARGGAGPRRRGVRVQRGVHRGPRVPARRVSQAVRDRRAVRQPLVHPPHGRDAELSGSDPRLRRRRIERTGRGVPLQRGLRARRAVLSPRIDRRRGRRSLRDRLHARRERLPQRDTLLRSGSALVTDVSRERRGRSTGWNGAVR